MELRRVNNQWRVHWSPAVVHPQLAENQSLELREQSGAASVVDRDGTPLLTPRQEVAVLLDRRQTDGLSAVAGTLAAALSQFDSTVTQQSIVTGANSTPDAAPYTVATLAYADYQQVRPQIYQLPGVRFEGRKRLLEANRGFAPLVLPAVSSGQLFGEDGWQIVVVDANGAQVNTLEDHPASAATPVTVTLSTAVQNAAQQAVKSTPQQAAIVALEPSSGELLAVAQNTDVPMALNGLFPPGSTFKIATASAALQTGTVTADSTVDCPATTTISGTRTIPNDPHVVPGTFPLHTTFAKSCNTTFAQLAASLPSDALPTAARQLGIGVDFTLAGGIATETGKVPPTENAVTRAEDGFGQGEVVASPFGMALMAATVAKGTMPTPRVLRGTDTPVTGAAGAPPPAAINALRQMMREVVTGGTASSLAQFGDLRGKTGTAEFGPGNGHAHGWFVGYRNNIAFAVLVADEQSATAALDVTAAFLTALG
jgi:cell division protein FtsI/penicillin-binding protein 2